MRVNSHYRQRARWRLRGAIAVSAALCGGLVFGASATVGVASASSAAGSTAAGFTLKIGILNSFTGELATLGPAWNRSIRKAISVIQADLKTLGLSQRFKIEAFTADDGGSTSIGVQAATKLVDVDGVDAILGPCCSSVTVAVAQSVTIPAGIPLFTMGTSPAISTLQSGHTIFRTVGSDALQAKVLAEVVYKALGKGGSVAVGMRNDAYGTGLADGFVQDYKALGGIVTKEVLWNPDQPTFDTDAQELTGSHPKAYVLCDYTGVWPKIQAALERTGAWSPYHSYGCDSMFAFPTTPAGVIGTISTVDDGPGYPYFKQVWDQNPDPRIHYLGTFEPQGWDDMMITFLAALAADSSNPKAIASKIYAVTNPGGAVFAANRLTQAIKTLLSGKKIKYLGATGPAVFTSDGDSKTSLFNVWRATDNKGDYKILETVSFTA